MFKKLAAAAVICHAFYAKAQILTCASIFENLGQRIQVTAPDHRIMGAMSEKYNFLSDSPEPLRDAFMGLQKKRMSLQAFKIIEDQWPNVNSLFKIVVFKEHLTQMGENFQMVERTFSKKQKKFNLLEETSSYYLLDFHAKDTSDVSFLGLLSSTAAIQPVVLAPFEGSPLKHLLQVPTAVEAKYSTSDKMESQSAPFINLLSDARISIELLDKIITYEGKMPLVVRYLVSKEALKELAQSNSTHFRGNKDDVERIVLKKISKDKLKFNSETDDLIAYDITISSQADLVKVGEVLINSVLQGFLVSAD